MPSGTGSYPVTFRYRLNGTGPWNGISNPGANQHTFNTGQTGNHQFMMIVTGPGGCLDTVIRCYTITQKPTAAIVAINPASPQCETSLPLTLNLSAAYGATITSYAWYLNGTLLGSDPSNNQSFPAAITSPGTYTLKLIVTDTSGCRDSAQQTYTVSAQPTASFTTSANTLCRGGRVCFTNTSTGTGPTTSYFWNFGDGSTSTKPNPCHNYRNSGTYTVSLQVCNPGSCCATTTQTITVLNGGLVDLTANGAQDTTKYCVLPGDPTTSYTVTFTDGGDCPGGGCTYQWDFGDGTPPVTTPTNAPQTHTYTSFGEWWADLTVTHPGGCLHRDSVYVVFQPVQVTAVFDIPAGNFGGCAPYTVTFQNISYTNATTFIWDYGDGQRDTVKPPSTTPFTHTYTATGTYQVTLYAMNACGSTYTIKGPINVVGKPRINAVNGTPNPGCAPQRVNFSVSATGQQPANNFYWNFGDGSSWVSGTATPSHTYLSPGVYTVTVVARNFCGDDTARYRVVIDTLPRARLLMAPTEGCHALTVTFTNLSLPGMAEGTSARFWEGLWIDGGTCCWAGCYPNYGGGQITTAFSPAGGLAAAL